MKRRKRTFEDAPRTTRGKDGGDEGETGSKRREE